MSATASVPDYEDSWIRPAILTIVALKIAGLALVVDPVGLQAFDLPKSLWSRATEWVLAGLVLLALLRFGTGILPKTRLHVFVALYALVVAVSGLFAINTYISLFGEQDSYQGLTFLGDMAVLYLAVSIAYRDPADWRPIGLTILGVAVLSSGYAVVQRIGADPLLWPIDPAIRPFSTFGNPNQLAHFLGVATGVAIGVAIFDRERLIRVAAGLCGLLFVVVAGLTGSRGGLLGLAVVLGTALVLVWRIRGAGLPRAAAIAALIDAALLAVWRIRGAGLPRAAAIAVVLGAALVSVVVALSPAGERLLQAGVADRLALYRTALEAVRERPLLGYGPDQFEIAFLRHRLPELVGVLDRDGRHVWAHDFLLQALVTTGVAGALALLMLLAHGTASLWRALRRDPRVAAPVLLGWAAYWPIALVAVPSVSVDWFPWLSLGVAAALTGTRREPAPRRKLAPLARAVIMTAACAGALTGVAALRANHDVGVARAGVAASEPRRALDAAESAVRLDPARSDYWNWLGIANEANGRPSEAEAAYREAVRRSDYVAIYWANLARARASRAVESGTTSSAKAEVFETLRRALEIDPYDSAVRRSYAHTALLFGECDLALDQILRAYALADGDVRTLADLDRAVACAVQAERARDALTDALAIREDAALHASVAVLALRAGDAAAARASATRAIELDPQNEAAREVLQVLGPG